ncbi:PIR Superfamily Protein [Plasmodium ovale wallikeri]|uniref:PIR Superfamily Protein n=1 Tax=Plasmodium ovale wallikeri TaxID=864142 RepID=A0A1A9AK11_PLAOA|nr:PIR Superfamily Protein [Plasmodium ovale wallikeri]SBT56523.1 PIR Superfamily Protein [Plasmodium ovale wallikeri]
MTNDIRKNDLPSIKHYNVLKECMHYNDIIDAIDKNKSTVVANNWSDNFRTYSSSYLDKYPDDTSNNSGKRCRDLIYLLEYIKTRITVSPIFDGQNDYMLSNIDNFVKSLKSYGYEECPINLTEHKTLYTQNRRKLDDLCEDITYINEKINEINNSSQCTDIKDHIIEQRRSVREKYDLSSYEYFDILKYYSYETFENIESTIGKIKCKTHNSVASEGTSQSSGEHTPILIVLPLLGIVLISFLLYKLTPLGPLLNTKIMKKTKYWKIINDNETDEILEHTSEIPKTYLHDKGYHMLYNTLGDS